MTILPKVVFKGLKLDFITNNNYVLCYIMDESIETLTFLFSSASKCICINCLLTSPTLSYTSSITSVSSSELPFIPEARRAKH